MAKKKKGGGPKKPAQTKRKPASKPKAAARGSARKPAGPRSQALPGMEQARNRRLDNLCESIGEGRDQSNRLRTEEKADTQAALREMHDKRIEVYRHAGVELVRVPGEEKLRVRTTKESASDITPDAEESGEVQPGEVADAIGEAAEL